MRWFAALTVLSFIETLVNVAGVATGLAIAFYLAVAGTPIWLAVLGMAAVWVVAGLWLDQRFKLFERLRDWIFPAFGFAGPAPSRPDQDAPRTHALFLGLTGGGVTLALLALPLALVIGPIIGQSLFDSTWMVIMVELAIGAPITAIGFHIAEDNARTEFGVDNSPTASDDPDFPDRLRERWQSEIDRDRNGKS